MTGLGALKRMRGWAFIVVVLLAGLLTWALVDGQEEEGNPYEFVGEIYNHGKLPHVIYYNAGVSPETLKKLGDHLELIGYFVPEYGGIVQIYAEGEGYIVYLTYRKEYWSNETFMEEMRLIGEDLEELVLERPISIVLVDEDAGEISRKVAR